MTQASIYTTIEAKLRELMIGHDVGGHGVDHMIAVMEHAEAAVACEDLPNYTKEIIILAALLHDADDPKIFKDHNRYENAKRILNETLTEDYLLPLMKESSKQDWVWSIRNHASNPLSTVTSVEEVNQEPTWLLNQFKFFFIEDVLELISLVSCSKNGNREPREKWMVIPRDCDRLEAIGEIGIQRCDEYSAAINAPDYTPDTVKVYTEEELWQVATPERFAKYKKSVSKIDHYYDKLLHIGTPECLKSQNAYILEEAARRNNLMVKYVLDFWNQIPSNI